MNFVCHPTDFSPILNFNFDLLYHDLSNNFRVCIQTHTYVLYKCMCTCANMCSGPHACMQFLQARLWLRTWLHEHTHLCVRTRTCMSAPTPVSAHTCARMHVSVCTHILSCAHINVPRHACFRARRHACQHNACQNVDMHTSTLSRGCMRRHHMFAWCGISRHSMFATWIRLPVA